MEPRIAPEEVELAIRTGPVEFPNPVFTASGTWGYGLEYTDLCDPAELGAVVTKTLTVLPRSGNPQPRVRELPAGMLNSIGLENVGLAAFLADKLPRLRERGVRVVASLAARDEAEFATMIAELAGHEGWCGVELNLSCPNVARGGLDFGQDPVRIERITRGAKEALPDDRCLWVKLTPNVSSIGQLAEAAQAGGADAISAINTLLGMEIDLRARRPVFPRGVAGYSGPAILPVALAKVWEVARAVDIPVVGIGGIMGTEDILKFFVAGATAVQVGTSLFPRPDGAHDMLGELRAALAGHGARHPREMSAARPA